ncbi:hypothetical protein OL548_17385 [Lysinibacillus sp. MHQ-1]|nr:hypothetical protein OL548_17385 [Lysinibacillus sp. MHQ-1]
MLVWPKNMMDSVAKQLTEEMNRMLYPLQQNQAIEVFFPTICTASF